MGIKEVMHQDNRKGISIMKATNGMILLIFGGLRLWFVHNSVYSADLKPEMIPESQYDGHKHSYVWQQMN